MDLKQIFEEKIKIEPKVMSIETIFNNPRRLKKTNYKPPYQRKYVWDVEKATYFIESIILGTEIPPLIFFNNSVDIEVIDGRQRYETILKFINNEFKLRKSGLHKFSVLANKNFKSLDKKLRDIIWDTKLRIIEFGFHSSSLTDEDIEQKVKNEIFKRYNSGITPLKTTDVDKAIFIENDLNTFFKNKIKSDRIIYDDVSEVFQFDKKNEEKLFKRIRRLLVLHQIPIKQYASKKDLLINTFFENYSNKIDESEFHYVFHRFINKVNILKKLLTIFNNKGYEYNHLIAECVFWALQIFEVENNEINEIDTTVLSNLSEYIYKYKDHYKDEQSSFSKNLLRRYKTTANFFINYFNLDFSIYIDTTDEFRRQEKELNTLKSDINTLSGIETLRINKPEPSSITIEDIIRQMDRSRFLIRPPYQRNEVINRKKSSSIIESIILGIKIPPIFIFKRNDGVSEVLDGQQRLLSILGYIQKEYLDENSKRVKSEKDGYSLNLKDGILKDLHGKSFKKLPESIKERIYEFDLWKIEIEQKNNPNFDPIDLFVRLNYKPYPIKENTFEMWNSYVDREIIETIKTLYNKNEDWFYYRKSNNRMDNETLFTALSYMQYKLNSLNKNIDRISDFLDIYKIGENINFRIKAKNDITKTIEDIDKKIKFIKACNDIENIFIEKVKMLTSYSTENDLEKNLNKIFNIENRRTQQRFYALWYFLSNISTNNIKNKTSQIIDDLKTLFIQMEGVESKDEYLKNVKQFWNKYL